jgi:CubicO group peptidase (beta-lactamase class C family)
MEAAVGGGVFPGGALLVRSRGRTVHRSFHGRDATEPAGAPVGEATCFDLASLTKVLATTPLVLLLVQQGRLALDDPVHRHLEEYPEGRRAAITVRMLLDHSSGLPAWRPFYEKLSPPEACTVEGQARVRGMVAAETPEAEPGHRVLYSDLNFVLLEWIVERAGGGPTDRLFGDWLAGPLRLRDLFYVDLKTPGAAARARCGRVFAATERCPWRGRILRGEVHDENAYAVGGVSGQAGLFGTVGDAGALAEAWLRSFHGSGPFDRRLVRTFWAKSPLPESTRALGWDTPTPGASQAGAGFGPRTVGHLGFTGTSVWIDPDRELIVVLLTNRVHPTRTNEAIRQFRPALHTRIAALCR